MQLTIEKCFAGLKKSVEEKSVREEQPRAQTAREPCAEQNKALA
jgi:hypothetical protein